MLHTANQRVLAGWEGMLDGRLKSDEIIVDLTSGGWIERIEIRGEEHEGKEVCGIIEMDGVEMDGIGG